MLLNKINTVPCLKSAYTCKIGKVFKKRRKLLSLTEFEVASQLYINVNYIKGIEQGDYSVFPARVFAKQYFRKYANYLNLKILTTRVLALITSGLVLFVAIRMGLKLI